MKTIKIFVGITLFLVGIHGDLFSMQQNDVRQMTTQLTTLQQALTPLEKNFNLLSARLTELKNKFTASLQHPSSKSWGRKTKISAAAILATIMIAGIASTLSNSNSTTGQQVSVNPTAEAFEQAIAKDRLKHVDACRQSGGKSSCNALGITQQEAQEINTYADELLQEMRKGSTGKTSNPAEAAIAINRLYENIKQQKSSLDQQIRMSRHQQKHQKPVHKR